MAYIGIFYVYKINQGEKYMSKNNRKVNKILSKIRRLSPENCETLNEYMEYEKFENEIEKVILKRNPIKNRKEMENKLIDFCRSEINVHDTTVEEILLALKDWYNGELRNEGNGWNTNSLAVSVLCSSVAVIVSVLVAIQQPVWEIALYVLILPFLALYCNHISAKILNTGKRGNYGYILSFLESYLNNKEYLKRIEREVEQKDKGNQE